MPARSATFDRAQDAVARFEDAWHDGGRPQIEDHLPAAPGPRYLALVELVHAELELRLKAGEAARVEEYLERFADLAGDDEMVLDLLAAEKVAKSFADQPDVEADVRLAVGLTYYQLGLYDEARPQLERTLALRRLRQGPDHVDPLDAVNELALLLQDQSQPAEAERLAREALRYGRKVLPAGDPTLADSLPLLGGVVTDTGRAEEAEPLLREALASRRNGQPAGDSRTARTEGQLGACLAAEQKFAEAEPLVLSSNQVPAKAPGTPGAERRRVRRRLVQLYEAWGKPSEAARWRADSNQEAKTSGGKTP